MSLSYRGSWPQSCVVRFGCNALRQPRSPLSVSWFATRASRRKNPSALGVSGTFASARGLAGEHQHRQRAVADDLRAARTEEHSGNAARRRTQRQNLAALPLGRVERLIPAVAGNELQDN